MSKKQYLFSFIILGVAIITSLLANAYVAKRDTVTRISIINTASAAEIDPLFYCPCCGNPLDKNNICCGQAQQRIDYIDNLIAQNLSEKEVIKTYVEKYGTDSFVDKVKEEEFKKELEKTAPANRPVISLNKNYLDLGAISQKKGIVSVYFEIKNIGKSDLVINKLDTSCGCTTASIVFNGSEGPNFGMDMPMPGQPTNPTNWRVIIPAGQKAQLKVYYDPNVHEDLRGPVTREVHIYSNDPINSRIKVQIDLDQED